MNSSCPRRSYSLFDQLWHNYSMDVSNYEHYVCRYSEYYEHRTSSDAIEGHLVLLFSGIGFFGGLLTVLTLTQQPFQGLNFRLYLFIGYLEMLQMAVLALMDSLAYVRCDASYSCTFLWAHVGITVLNVCADATDILVLFLCGERTVACLLPHHFQKVHNIRCYKITSSVAIVTPAVFSLFQAFELQIVYDSESNQYSDEPSRFSQTDFYGYVKKVNTIRFYMTAGLIAITTGLSIWGFVSVARRRKLLTKRKATPQPTEMTSSSMKEASTAEVSCSIVHRNSRLQRSSPRSTRNRQMELCCLQLCLAVPVVINHLLYGTGLSWNNFFLLGELALKKIVSNEITISTAIREIERAESFQYLRAATNVSNVMAHALHFYLYVMFSVKVRHGFITLCRACWKKKSNRRSFQTDTIQTNTLRHHILTTC